jgi:hypothetical protein
MNNRVKKLFDFIVIYTRYFVNSLIIKRKGKIKNTSTGIIFSMDRPLQLNALLESYYEFCDSPESLIILYKSTNETFNKGYIDVINHFKNIHDITFIKEIKFKKDLLKILKIINTHYVFFLVDDNLFINKFNFIDFYKYCESHIFSMRMGQNIKYSYTHDLPLKLPDFNFFDGFLNWKWQNKKYEWGYTFSVDGNIYISKMILCMAKSINFKGPNSFEAQMNRFRYIFYKKLGLCSHLSILTNLNLNRVQNEITNKSGEISTTELIKHWNNGLKLDYSKYKYKVFSSCHIDSGDLDFIKRFNNGR